MTRNPKDYEVGYKKPPKDSQFAPGTSGNKGRRRKPESQAEIIARVRDEKFLIDGKQVTAFELALRQTITQTIRSGKVRDLKMLFDLLDAYGGMTERDLQADMEAAGQKVKQKIRDFFERSIDHELAKARDELAEDAAR